MGSEMCIRDSNKRDLSLPPISGEDKSTNEHRKQTGGHTKLPKINTEPRNSGSVMRSASWLEKQDMSTISWKKALDVLDDKTRDYPAKQHKRPRNDVEYRKRETGK